MSPKWGWWDSGLNLARYNLQYKWEVSKQPKLIINSPLWLTEQYRDRGKKKTPFVRTQILSRVFGEGMKLYREWSYNVALKMIEGYIVYLSSDAGACSLNA